MKKVLPLLFLSLALFNCRNDKPKEASVENQIDDLLIVPGERVGMITRTTTEAELEQLYGAENLKMQRIAVAEDSEREGVILFPGTNKEVEIIWQTATSEGTPAFVRISKDSTVWKTEDGITIGSTLEALEKVNGTPFQFYGFEWDYSGLVTDWKDGKFDRYFVVALVPQDFNAINPDMMGEVQLSSDDDKVRAVRAKVGSMVITFD